MASEEVTLWLTSSGGALSQIGVDPGTSTCFVETKLLQIHPQGRECYIDGLRIEITELEKLADTVLKIGWADKINDTVNWAVNYDDLTQEFQLVNANSIFNLRIEAKYLKIRIEDRQIRTTWQLSGIEVYGRQIGGRNK